MGTEELDESSVHAITGATQTSVRLGKFRADDMAEKKRYGEIVLTALWGDNPIFRQILGICSALAVTNLVLNTAVMGVAVMFTTALSGLTVSLLRNITPRRIRMMVETLIIAFYVILFDQALKAYWPDMSRNLGPYVGLIITNCIIMGRAEAFANSNPPLQSFVDGFFSGAGYAFVLLAVSVVRELLGMGSILGIPIPFFSSAAFDRWIIMVMPPGAFFTLAVFVWLFRSLKKEEPEKGGK
jgi:Na+-transporting NADH:ubiquinone oxidoreductase subunit D